MTTIFTLTSARSGTLYLRNLFKHNVANCASRHEPFFDWGNPTMFGPAIYDASAGRIDKIRSLLAKKERYIRKLNVGVYIESSHAFLKSAYVAAMEFFPDMKLVHLIRDPRKVAKSEAYREMWRRRVRAPFHYYRAENGKRYFRWSLTGEEPIYQTPGLPALNLFQRYLLQWIEVENRAIAFLDEHRLHERCFVLHTPGDLNREEKIRELFEFLRLPMRQEALVMAGRKNKNLCRTTQISAADEADVRAVLEALPPKSLEIFARAPYVDCKWQPMFANLESTERSAGDRGSE